MKLSYIYSEGFRGLFSVGFILAVITLLSSCSSELPDLSLDQVGGNENVVESQVPALLRFKTVEELENISIADIPGDHSGFELKELSYECVDTIELRALLFDVKAKLCSSSNHEKVISFSAEVGPELVSVEYYPGGEMVPAHHNMGTAYYPKVERYRNYSDGSRIGPDEFYDYGHYVFVQVFTNTGLSGIPAVTGGDLHLIPRQLDNGNINPEFEYYENGVVVTYEKGIVEYNLNTTVIEEDCATHSGDDLFHIMPRRQWTSNYSIRNDTGRIRGNYYCNSEIIGNVDDICYYLPSRLSNSDEEKHYLNLCKDVPDVSPQKYPIDTESLCPGWYFGDFTDYCTGFHMLYSKRELSMYNSSFQWKGIMFVPFVSVYLQYLVIDNRIIHFDDVCFKDYCGPEEFYPSFKVSKTSSGYLVRSEFEVMLYGEKFKSIYDLELKGVEGEAQTIDHSRYSSTAEKDQEELNNFSTRSMEIESEIKTSIPRKDGKVIVIDRHLPNDIINLKTRSTIKRN